MQDRRHRRDSEPTGEALHRQAVRVWTREHDAGAAIELLEQARLWSSRHGDESLWRRTEASLCALELSTGKVSRVPLQREILLATKDATTAAIAANNLSCLFDDLGDARRALFYASLAVHHAGGLRTQGLLASALNQTGNVHLAATRLPEAERAYVRALQCRQLHPVDRATLLDNLGYCRLLGGRHVEGIALLRASLRQFLRAGRGPQQCLSHLSLCQAALELGRSAAARDHSRAALDLARANEDPELLRNALFFAGESVLLDGDEHQAHDLFAELGARFYPGIACLEELLLVVDVGRLVNLRA